MGDQDIEIEIVDNGDGLGFEVQIRDAASDEFDELCSTSRVRVMVCEDHVHLSGLYVPISQRRKGYAKALMKRTLRYLEQLQLDDLPVLLDTRSYGTEQVPREVLRKFYAQFGFWRWPAHPSSMALWPESKKLRQEVEHG